MEDSIEQSVVNGFLTIHGRVEVVPQGPLDGDIMANGRVEMAVREV